MTSGSSSADAFTEITLNDSFWLNQAMSFQVLGGQIDASILTSDGNLLVNVTATGSDLDLTWSLLRVNYEVDATRLASRVASTS